MAARAGGLSVAVVGAGPSGAGLVERLAANAPELVERPLTVHLVDPHPPGAGRVWRYEQSPLLWMNSMPEDVTLYHDESVAIDGPRRTGPTLAEWSALVRDTGGAGVPEDLRAEFAEATPTRFPTRRLQSAYLDHYFQGVLADLPPGVEVVVHPDTAVDITGPHDGPQTVRLAESAIPLVVDAVVLAGGHMDVTPTAAQADLAVYAREHDLRYFAPAYTSDVDLSALRPGEDVIVRGFGLAFVDLFVLLTEGRGGRFTERGGRLDYHPSGKEPRLHVGSRRGVPYHAKPECRPRAPLARLPRFFTDAAVAALPGPLDFRRDLWPLLAKDVALAYYTELFTAHPDRVRMSLAEFEDGLAAADWAGADLRELVAAAVPAEEDRLDLDGMDRPLAGRTFGDAAAFTEFLHDHITADLARRADPRHSADVGAFVGLLVSFGQLARVVATGRVAPDSQVDDVDGWWFGFFSFYASGPPGPRLRQLLALSRAGIVTFAGPDMWVRAEDGVFRAGSPAVPGVVEATALVEARLPAPALPRATDPLLTALRTRGEISEEVLDNTRPTGRIAITRPGQLLSTTGAAHPRRYAHGPHTSIRAAAAFNRPWTNAPGLRRLDVVARNVLKAIARA
ncbi:FAD/NAD(P)-binding protein [Actinokineospora sp. G85]|uniref:FAD/NAD(P)-binding protein n=1 Tax=Actinokineospora sp. G85 TaxID=3406626 RepID=UPI003C76C6BC